MKIPSFNKLKVAAGQRNHFEVGGDVITTNDFGLLRPIFCRECIPGDKLTINIESFARLAPMPVPTFGRCELINRAYYVRYADIWQGWKSFIMQQPFFMNGQTYNFSHVPMVSNRQLVNTICNVVNGLVTQVYGDNPFDIIKPSSSTFAKYKFTNAGRNFMAILNGLGYRLNFDDSDMTEFNLLPLLAYYKIYFDHFVPLRYKPSHTLRSVFSRANMDWSSFAGDLQSQLQVPCYSYFNDDIFVNAWDNPMGPKTSTSLDGINDPRAFKDSSYDLSFVSATSGYGASINQGPDTITNGDGVSAFLINACLKAQNWLYRKGLTSNSSYLTDILSQFGVKPRECCDGISVFLGKTVQPIQISDVMSTASSDTDNPNNLLGSYAGKGISYGDGTIHCECSDYGVLIVLTEISPKNPQYFQGYNRQLRHINYLDFYTPDFEKLGTQPIENGEIYHDYPDGRSSVTARNNQVPGALSNGVFGFAPRYYEYKVGSDKVLGDFNVKSLNTGLDAYYLARTFGTFDRMPGFGLNQSFMSKQGDSQYNDFNRIFAYMGTDDVNGADHFYCYYTIHAHLESKMCSLTEAIPVFGDGDVIGVPANTPSGN
nr:MAG: major capsid protein [Microviridae sp.]